MGFSVSLTEIGADKAAPSRTQLIALGAKRYMLFWQVYSQTRVEK
jgi:hypothetical protein